MVRGAHRAWHDEKEKHMRTSALYLGVAASLMLSGAAPAAAMTAAGSTGIRAAVKTVDPVEHVACWRWGWRGWGLYPGCGFVVAPAVVAAPVVAAPVVAAPPVVAPAPAPAGRCKVDGHWQAC
jgi:hypothetical protein